jgi:hypothetical protein
MKMNASYLSKFKSPWYYWYAGYKYKAVFILFACTLVSWFLLGLTAGFDIFLILFFLVLDAAGLILLLVYLLFLRPYIPEVFEGLLDGMAVWHFFLAAISIIINRCVTYFIACKVFKLPFDNGFNVQK